MLLLLLILGGTITTFFSACGFSCKFQAESLWCLMVTVGIAQETYNSWAGFGRCAFLLGVGLLLVFGCFNNLKMPLGTAMG